MRTENGLFYLGPCRYLLLNSLPPHPIQIRSHRYNGISLEFIDDRHFLMLVKDSPPDAPGISIHTATLFTRRAEAGSWDISRVRFQAGRGWGPDTSGDGDIDVSANGVIGVRFDRYLSGKNYPLFKDHFAGAGYYHAGTEPSWNYVSEIDAKRLEKQLQSLSNRSGALEQTTRLGKRLMFQRLNDNCVVFTASSDNSDYQEAALFYRGSNNRWQTARVRSFCSSWAYFPRARNADGQPLPTVLESVFEDIWTSPEKK